MSADKPIDISKIVTINVTESPSEESAWFKAAMELHLDPGHVLVSRPWFEKFAKINNERHDLLVLAERQFRLLKALPGCKAIGKQISEHLRAEGSAS